MYTIKVDEASNQVEVEFSGMVSVDEAALYVFELQRAFIADRLRAGYSIVVDLAECPVQSQATIGAMRAHMATMPKAGAIAVVVGSSPVRMQATRLFTQAYARIVDTPDQARAWIGPH